MEGIEIVVNDRMIERLVYGAVIIILVVLLVFHWGGNSCSVIDNKTTANTVATQAPIVQNTTPAPAATSTPLIAAACSNTVKDGTETDIDCGGSCPACAEYKSCNVDKDCGTGLYCYQHIKCMKPTCDDGVKNQDETNVDCGGVCGGYWWTTDGKCHATLQPSGKIDVALSADVGKSTLSSSAVLNSLTIKITNGLATPLNLVASIYALTSNGGAVFQDMEGNNIAIATVTLPTIDSMDKLTKVVDLTNVTRRTLPAVKSTDAYQLLVQFKDENNKLVESDTWTNS